MQSVYKYFFFKSTKFLLFAGVTPDDLVEVCAHQKGDIKNFSSQLCLR